MIVAEMRPTHMPVEVLRFEIQRKDIRQQSVQRSGDVFHGFLVEIGRRSQRRLLATCDFRCDGHNSSLRIWMRTATKKCETVRLRRSAEKIRCSFKATIQSDARECRQV